eukprot:g3676.t1
MTAAILDSKQSHGGYHGLKVGAKKEAWVTEAAHLDQERLDIDGHPVMQRWETTYMDELARVACSNGGTVLEVGFGMGISANAVQQHSIDKHVILEANADVFKTLCTFAKSSQRKVIPVGPGLWQDTLPGIARESVDGVLYDTYPLTKEEQHTHQFEFVKAVYDKMKAGGILTYCNLTSLGVLRNQYSSWEELFETTQLPHLERCGFSAAHIEFHTFPTAPTPNCEYYAHDTALVPVCRKVAESAVGAAFEPLKESAVGAAFEPLKEPSSLSFGVGKGATKASHASAKLSELLLEVKKVQADLAAAHEDDNARRQRTSGELAAKRRVNSWTGWGELREVVVGVADHACFIPPQPAEHPSVNLDEACGVAINQEIGWPEGRKKQDTIDAANAQLDAFAATLEQRGIRVMRPSRDIDWSVGLRTPMFEVANQYCSACPRDVVITLGNIILEAAPSRRDRYFEVLALRDIIAELRSVDDDFLWKAAPRPSLRNSMYKEEWWKLEEQERYDRMHKYDFCIAEDEPVFDAADIARCGKDVFVQLSKTCNRAGVDWLRRELKPHGIRVHQVRFPYDLAPSHLDCTFVPLKPGLVLTNPERPLLEEDAAIFKKNGWRFVDAPMPINADRPWGSQSSKWLSMNILPLGPTAVAAEAEETALHALLEDEGFEVVPVPFRNVYEFGGGIHCATWDLMRDGGMEDYFPLQ